jgi:hypothetical protein
MVLQLIDGHGASSRPSLQSLSFLLESDLSAKYKHPNTDIEMSNAASYKDDSQSITQHDALAITDPDDCMPCRVTG